MRIKATVVALFACALASAAEEKPATPQRPAEDPLATAKRELELIKAARENALPHKGDAPQLDVPELHQPSPSSMSPAAKAKARAKALKEREEQLRAKNWLVDAMRETPKSQADQAGGGAGLALEQRVSLDAEGNTRTLSVATAEAQNKEQVAKEEPRKPVEAINPLTPFLADWMTPQDYALLRPSIEPISPGVSGPTENMPTSVIAAESTSFMANELASVGPASKPAFTPPAPQENPYLQVFTPPPAPAPVFTPAPSAPMLTPPGVEPLRNSPPPVPQKPQIPDFSKQQKDEKYFKPLKRF